LASAGIGKAIRDATLALRVVCGENSKYGEQNGAEFNEYRGALVSQYRLETRWANSNFWKQHSRRIAS
jgi:hypothetical protein